MKYVKTFENFDYQSINEEEEFLKNLWNKFTSFLTSIKDRKVKSIVENIKETLESKKDEPEVKKFLKELSDRYNSLSQSDKDELSSLNPETLIEDMKEAPVSENRRNRRSNKMNESVDLNGVIGNILRRIGIGSAVTGFITWAVATFQSVGVLGKILGTNLSIDTPWVPVVSVIAAVLVAPALIAYGGHLRGDNA
jgi:hypothetical protein